jgi:hypothetical protein
MFKKQTKKIDTSFLKYLTEDDLATPHVSMDQVKKNYPHTKNSNLEACKLFYMLNVDYLDAEQKKELLDKIDILYKQEEAKFKIAFDSIDDNKNNTH